MSSYRFWTPEEEQQLRDAYAELGPQWDRIAKRFPGRSWDAVETKWRRMATVEEGLPQEPPARAEAVDVGRHDYLVADGNITFAIDDKLVKIPMDRWETICAQYSSLGGNLTRAQVARRNGLPLRVLMRMLALYGHYKASPPVSRERIAEHGGDLQPLVDEAVENLELRLSEEIEEARDRKWRNEYKRLRRELDSDDRLAAQAERAAANIQVGPPSKPERRTGEPWDGIIPTTDEHFGLYVWSPGAFGEAYDSDIAHARLVAHGERVAEWVQAQPGRCQTLVRPYLGDLFHALSGSTEHGTLLDMDTRHERVWEAGLDAVIQNTNTIAAACGHLILHFIPGNHDGKEMFRFAKTIQIAFQDRPDVEVRLSRQRYSCELVGETLHVFDHGYRVGSLSGWKAKAQAEVVAREIAGHDRFRQATSIVVYSGHLHSFEAGSNGAHLELWRLPSLAEVDDYASDLRYSGSPAAYAFRLNERGAIGAIQRWEKADLEPSD